MFDPSQIVEVRRKHRPLSVCASCSKWECCECRTTWPCAMERELRDAGVSPIGIYGYGRGEHLRV